MYQFIDMSGDPRRAQFDYFRTMASPYVSVTVPCDITPLRAAGKERGLPFFLTLLHTAIGAANDVPELRRRIKGDRVAEYDRCLSSHTVALENGAYCYCTLDCAKPLEEFLPYAQEQVAQAVCAPEMDDGEDPDELYFVSSLPWLSFTALSLPVPNPADSNVRITFGKFYEQDGKILLPLNLTAHHALADGIHLARFYEAFERRVKEFA